MTEFRKSVVFFKPVPGGYVYRAPNTWLLGSRRHFLVTEAQKAAILAIASSTVGPVLWITGATWIALSALLGAALSLWMYRYYRPGLVGIGAMISMMLSIYPAFVLSRQLLLRRLRPILATLPPTSERITSLEERQAIQAVSQAPISPIRRRIVRVAAVVAMTAALGAMISRAIDMYEPTRSELLTLYLANTNLSGILNIVTIVAFGLVFVAFGRNSSQA